MNLRSELHTLDLLQKLTDALLIRASRRGVTHPTLQVFNDGDIRITGKDGDPTLSIELVPLADVKRRRVGDLDQTLALSEGWCVNDLGDFLEIQANDEGPVSFATDRLAQRHVMDCATGGSEYHLRALYYVTQENFARYCGGRGTTGTCYMLLRSWDKEAIVDKEIIRVRSDYDMVLGPYQEAVRQAIGSNQDIAPLNACTSPDVTFHNDAFLFSNMQVHTDPNDHDYPLACTCGNCKMQFPIDPVSEENLRGVFIEGRLVNVAKCPQCGALAYEPKPRKQQPE